jgi:hypothetical protein
MMLPDPKISPFPQPTQANQLPEGSLGRGAALFAEPNPLPHQVAEYLKELSHEIRITSK